MHSILTDAQLAQRDASRRLYFVAAGCLYHPQAHLVLDNDPTSRVALEQSAEAALQFAELSEEEEAAFRRRAVAATRVVRTGVSTFAFRQPERKPRRQGLQTGFRRYFSSAAPDTIAPAERRQEMRGRVVFLRLLGALASVSFIAWGIRIICAAADAVQSQGTTASYGAGLVGAALVAVGAVLLWRMAMSLID